VSISRLCAVVAEARTNNHQQSLMMAMMKTQELKSACGANDTPGAPAYESVRNRLMSLPRWKPFFQLLDKKRKQKEYVLNATEQPRVFIVGAGPGTIFRLLLVVCGQGKLCSFGETMQLFACRPIHVCLCRRYAHGDRGAAVGQSSDAGGDAQALHAPQPASRTSVFLRNTLAQRERFDQMVNETQQVWMSSIRDLRNIGAKFLYPQFCTGGIK
jgi:hypothetical protein